MALAEELLQKCASSISPEEYSDSLLELEYSRKISSFLLHVTPTVAVIALLSSIIISILTATAVINSRLSKRHYGLVLSNYFSDIITSLIIISAGVFSNFTQTTFSIYAMAFIIITMSVTHSSIHNLIFCFLVQDNQQRSETFRRNCSPTKIIASTIGQWTFSIMYSLAFVPLMLMFYSVQTLHRLCSYSHCQLPLLYLSIVILSIFLIAVIVTYLYTASIMHNAVKNEESRNETPFTKPKLFKFLAHGGRVALYLLITLLILCGAIVILVTHIDIHNLSKQSNECNVRELVHTGNRLRSVCGGIVLLWLVKMIFDPVIHLAIDYQDLMPWLTPVNNLQRLRAESIYSLTQAQGEERKKRATNSGIKHMEIPFGNWDMKN